MFVILLWGSYRFPENARTETRDKDSANMNRIKQLICLAGLLALLGACSLSGEQATYDGESEARADVNGLAATPEANELFSEERGDRFEEISPVMMTMDAGKIIAADFMQRSYQGPHYYVSTDGDDANDGGPSAPWRTIAHAATAVMAGTIHVAPGVYTEVVVLRNAGSADQYITLLGEDGAVLDGSLGYDDADYGLLSVVNANYIVIDNIDVVNARTHGIMVLGDSHDIVIRNCKTEHTRGSGINVQGNFGYPWDQIYHVRDILIENNQVIYPQEGRFDGNNIWHEDITLRQGVEYFEVRNNYVKAQEWEAWDGGPLGIDVKDGVRHGAIHHNTVVDIPSGGIYVDAWETLAEDIDIFNNYVGNVKGVGIEIGAEQGGPVDDINVYNNVIVDAGWHGILSSDMDGKVSQPKTNINIFNNTVYQSCQIDAVWAAGIGTDPMFQNGRVYNNLVVGTGSDAPALRLNQGKNNRSSNNFTGDPLFTHAAKGDFTLQSGSPAIDAGTSDGAPAFDFNDDPRPQGLGVDMGAYEYGNAD
jgi:hypothetical protein